VSEATAAAVQRTRPLALVALGAALIFVVFGGYLGETPGNYGAFILPAAITSGTWHLGTVEPGSALANAGVRSGDPVRWAHWNLRTRAALVEAVEGSHLDLVTAAGRRIRIVAKAGPKHALPFGLTAVRVAYLLVAGLLVLRRWQDRSTRSLAYFLGAFGLGLGLPNANPVVSPLFSFALFYYGTIALLLSGGAAAADFSAHFASAPTSLERTIARAATITAVIALVVVGVIQFFVTLHGSGARQIAGLLSLLPLLLAIATLVAGYLPSRGADRSRRLWVLLIVGVGLVGPAADFLVTAIAGYNATVDQFALLTLAIIPIGLAYVILRHRLIDVGFVLNQAAVYAGVSLVVVGVVAIVETLLSNYVERTSHVTSTAVQLGVALALGYSINAIHKRVEALVDRMFFRERHEAEAALHAFSLDAQYVTEPAVLLGRCVEVVERNARAAQVGIWMRDASDAYVLSAGDFPAGTPIDPNDPAVLAMRARHVIVDPRREGSALPGALAFPMVASGELIGILACDARRDQETYAPDERAALEQVATGVAHAWNALRIRELERRLAAR
jgi:hypothetical protein